MADKTVFLVDDNVTNLTMGKNVLKEHYKTFTMPSAQKMFDLLKTVTPDIILLDIEMPEMSGYEAIKILKTGQYKDIPVIFVTGGDAANDENKGKELGAIDYIRKPFLPKNLLDSLGKALQA
jgi:CheY-like chemotaxis protein